MLWALYSCLIFLYNFRSNWFFFSWCEVSLIVVRPQSKLECTILQCQILWNSNRIIPEFLQCRQDGHTDRHDAVNRQIFAAVRRELYKEIYQTMVHLPQNEIFCLGFHSVKHIENVRTKASNRVSKCHAETGYGDWTVNFRLSCNNDVVSLFVPRLQDLLQLLLSVERAGTNRTVHCTQGRHFFACGSNNYAISCSLLWRRYFHLYKYYNGF